MQKLLITAVATIALGAGQALAADLPAAPYRAPVVAAPVFDWTGLYIGANVGFSWARADATAFGATASENLNGIIGGGQIGFNWQTGNWVLGIEADGQATGQKATATTVIGPIAITEQDSLPWLVTVRGRVGYAVAPMWLLYATAGGAWADFKSTISITGLGTATWEVSHGGWTAGAGIEAAINRNWSWKAEYLFVDTGTFGTNIFGVLPASVRFRDNIGRFGINYRF